MQSPFQFGRVVVGDTFTDRNSEIKRLKANIENNIHTMLISPRRWGKSSLVKQTALHLEKNKKIKFCFIDLFKTRNEEDFYSSYTRAVIKAISSKTEEIVGISLGTDPLSDFEISFDMKGMKQNYEDVLNLPEKIAEKKNINIIVCIDEFQNLGHFDEPVVFQKRLRAVWQHHQRVAYILYGSKRHMLMHLFENKSMPFYKFGDVIYLDKIPAEDLKTFIANSFSRTGKTIAEDYTGQIAASVKCHPYYTQQLAHLTWLGTENCVSAEILNQAVEELLNQNSLLYQKEIETLSNIQVNFLKAITGGVNQLSSTEAIKEYNLNSSANVTRLRKALEKKEIIDVVGKRIEFIDPVFELWFRRYYSGVDSK